MHLGPALKQYRAYCTAHNISPQTWRWYEQKLRALASYLAREQQITDLADIRAPHVYAFTQWLQDTAGMNDRGQRSTYTIKGYVQVVKTFLMWASEEEYVPRRVVERIDLPKVEKRVIRTFSREQYDALWNACMNEYLPWLAHRDRAILAVLSDTGVRAGELCSLTLDHTRLLDTDPHLVVYGKGRREREVGPLGKQSALALKRYINRYRPDVAEGVREVFLSKFHLPITPEGLDKLLYRLRDWAGAEEFAGIRVSAHTFRHTYAVRYMEAGGDIHTLSLLLGHTSVAVTENYLRDFKQREARKGRSVLDNWE